ncbi:MAG: rod shape-determining protein MreD [Pseudomonadota bacterium]
MSEASWPGNMGRWLIRTLPFLTLLMAVLASHLPLPTVVAQNTMPPLVLSFVFLWAVYRPNWLPISLVFITGLLMDVLGSVPLGLNAILLILVYWPVAIQRRVFLREPFPFLWVSFAAIVALVEVLRWLFVSLIFWSFAPVGLVLSNLVVGIGLFPLIAWLVIQGNHRFTRLDPEAP